MKLLFCYIRHDESKAEFLFELNIKKIAALVHQLLLQF